MSERTSGPIASGTEPASVVLGPGTVVAERFRIVRRLGSGGMGEVYEAWDQELGTAVALKTLRSDLVGDHVALERFRREIQVARQVTHRNVCRIFDFVHDRAGDAGGLQRRLVGLTMELLPGETLSDRLARTGPMAPERVLPIVRQVAAALMAAHRAGVVHRDLKAGNVMLVPGESEGVPERVVVTDFGLACQVAGPASSSPPLTGLNMVVGTADYMAPEQAQGTEATPASDIYSLGVILFELVTGRRPHEAPTPMATLLRRLREPAPSPRELRPDIELRWDLVIRRCLALRPEDRFGTAAEVVAALEGRSGSHVALLDGVDETPATSQLPVLTARRARPVMALALLAAVAGVVAVWLVATRVLPDRPAAAPPTPRQLTTWPGLELDPALSPDGHTVAFAANRSGRFEIYLQQLAPGGREIQLTSDGEQSFQPAWSPDGAYLAYASHGRGGIWVLPALGGTPRQAATFGSHPAFSPDGRLLAFQSDSTAELSANAVPALPPSTLWVVPVTGGQPRQVTQEGAPAGGHGAPAWTPDGRRLVFTASDRRGSSVWSVDAGGTDVRPVADQPAFCFDPLCAPDGRRLLFAGVSSGEQYAVWSVAVGPGMRATGQPAVVFALPMASVRQIDLSRDGHRLVHAALGTATNLWSLPLDQATGDAAGPAVALTTGSGRYSRPIFSPDGTLLAFDRRQVGASQDIWVMAPDGTAARQVSSDPANDANPTFLPGGAGIAFVSERADGDALWSVATNGGNEQRVCDLPAGADGVRVSPDGRQAAYHLAGPDGAVNLWVKDISGGAPRQLTFDPELVGFPCWSPDGTWLAAERRRGDDDHLVVVPAAGGEPVQLTTGHGRHWPHSWSPAGDRIAVSVLRDGRWNLCWVSRGTGELRQLTRFDALGEYVRYPAWSPQGDRIVFVRAETSGDLWLVENLP